MPGTDLAPEPEPEPEPAGPARTTGVAAEPAVAPEPEPAAAVQPVPAVEPEGAGAAGNGEGDGGAETVGDRPKGRRPVLRAVLRWTAAVAVFAAVGASTAYGITRMERTDVPGLRTESDGRWAYPTLTKPPLPSGSPGPYDAANTAGAHYADLRALVLPAPEGATEDAALRGSDGWLATKDFLAEYAEPDDRTELGGKLADHGLRHIAASGWTTPDGTHTRVYLLHFGTAAVVDSLYSGNLAQANSPSYAQRGATLSVFDEEFPVEAQVENVDRSAYTEPKPFGAEQVRHAYLAAGDVLALIVQSRKGGAAAIPFQQTVTLQSQLLG
ncbi:hypothetical protein [Streptomyces sp. NPDC006527]|uniref:hypothetical protein n=1 Tax=Streptomyces sp. NPDC006527 TaxID=3364749 RepID=UPI00368DC7A2